MKVIVTEKERRLIERIRESDEAKQIVEDFLAMFQKCQGNPQGPSGAQESSI